MLRAVLLAAIATAGLAYAAPARADVGFATASVNLRTCPSSGCRRILTIPRGAQVWIYYCERWCNVRYAGRRGFAYGRYIAHGGYSEPPIVIYPPVYRPPYFDYPPYHYDPPRRYRKPPRYRKRPRRRKPRPPIVRGPTNKWPGQPPPTAPRKFRVPPPTEVPPGTVYPPDSGGNFNTWPRSGSSLN